MAFRDQPLASPVLIGRTREVLRLTQALQAARQGTGQCLLIAGEAGIGKSRLLAELERDAADAQFTILHGNCFEEDSSFPYAPWVDGLRTLLAPCSPEEIRAMLGPFVADLMKLLPELAAIFPDAVPTSALDAEAEKRRLFDALARLAARLAGNQPLLVGIEDLHWSDETSLGLLHLFARRLTRYPVLLVATYRRDRATPPLTHWLAEMNRERLAQEIVLSGLAREEVSEMVRAIFHLAGPIKSDFLDRIVPLAEGNPFFVEEILRSLVESGDIFLEDGQWERKAADELHVPPSIRDAVLLRTDSLAGEARQLLTLAAVAGQRFHFSLLRELSGTGEAELVQWMKELVAAQLVVEESADEFAFRHALTREAVYSTLLVRERRALHQRIGETLEQFYPEAREREAHVAELAYHFYQAQVWGKALAYAQQAGEKALDLYALPEAITHLTRALDAAQRLGLPPPFAMLRGRGTAHETLGHFELALADFQAALDQARAEQNRRAEWQTLLDLGFLWVSRDYQRAGEYFRDALDRARTLGDPAALGHTLNRIGNWHLNLDEPLDAVRYHREALDIFEELNDARGLAETYELLGVSHYNCGDAIQGAADCERATELYRELNDRQGLLQAMTHRLLPAVLEDEVTEPIPAAQIIATTETARNMARDMGWRGGEAQALGIMNETLSRQGDYGRSLAAGQAALAIAQEIGHRAGIGMSNWMLGHTYLDIFALAQAQRLLQEGLAAAQETSSIMFLRLLIPGLASISILQHDFTNAEALLDRVPHDDIRHATRGLRVWWRVRAELELARGNATQALAIADELLASTVNVEKYGPHAVARLCYLRGQTLAALDRNEEAEAELHAALETARRQERRPLVWRIHVTRGKLYQAEGQKEKAEREFTAARSTIQELADSIPEGALRENFVQQALAMLPPIPAASPRQVAKQGFGGLTARERQVAGLIAQGKSNREVAIELVLSERTVEKHVANIFSKLGFASRAQVAVWAVARGLAGQADR